jgi:hypothetical protein
MKSDTTPSNMINAFRIKTLLLVVLEGKSQVKV